MFYYAAESLRTYSTPSRSCAQPSPTLGFRFPREGRECEEAGVIAICKPLFVLNSAIHLGHFVGTIFEVRLRAVPSEPPAVFAVVGALSAMPTFVIHYPIYIVGLKFRLSLVWMAQFGKRYGFSSNQIRNILEWRCWRCFLLMVGLYVGEVDGHFSGVVRKSCSIQW